MRPTIDHVRPPLPPLDALAAFEAAGRHESFVKAAAELHLSPSAVSHRVKLLERHLGHRLFRRLPHGVQLTDRGHAYLPRVRSLFDDLATATGDLFGPSSRDRIVVSASISYCSRFLAPNLSDFVEESDIEVLLVSRIWTGAVSADEVDIEIRLGPAPPDGEILANESALLITHPTPVDRPQMVEVLGYADLGRSFTIDGPAIPGTLSTDTWEGAIGLVESSPRLCAVVPSIMVRTPVARGAIAIAPAPAFPMDDVYWIYTADPTTLQRPAVFGFLSWLRARHEQGR